MTAKQYLSQAFSLNTLIEANKLELARLRELVPGNGRQDRVGETTARIVDLERGIQRDIDRYLQLKTEIRRLVTSVEDLTLRNVLAKRYLNFQKWEKIAVDMNFTYRWIHRLHAKALLAAEKLIGHKSSL